MVSRWMEERTMGACPSKTLLFQISKTLISQISKTFFESASDVSGSRWGEGGDHLKMGGRERMCRRW